MPKTTDLTVTINSKIDVDYKTAKTCLLLIEAFMNNHPEVDLIVTRKENGEKEYRFLNKETDGDNTCEQE